MVEQKNTAQRAGAFVGKVFLFCSVFGGFLYFVDTVDTLLRWLFGGS